MSTSSDSNVTIVGDVNALPDEGTPFTWYHVHGFTECPWFHRAACIAGDLATTAQKERQHEIEVNDKLSAEEKESIPSVEVTIRPTPRNQFGNMLNALKKVYTTTITHTYKNCFVAQVTLIMQTFLC
jgi:hypothetical protein